MLRDRRLPDGRMAWCPHESTTRTLMGEVARIARAGDAPEAASMQAIGACIMRECPLIPMQEECPKPFQDRFDTLQAYVEANRLPLPSAAEFASTITKPNVHDEAEVDTFLGNVAELSYLQVQEVRPKWSRTSMIREPGLCAKLSAIMQHNLSTFDMESILMYHPFPESHYFARTLHLPVNKDSDLTWQQLLPEDHVEFDVPDALIAPAGELAQLAVRYGVAESLGRFWNDTSPDTVHWRDFKSSLLWEVIAPGQTRPKWLSL